jgi:hypothetical protein
LFRRFFLTVVGAGLLTVPSLVLAQVTPAKGSTPPDDTQSVKFGVTLFYDYTFTKSPKTKDSAGNEISANAFNVSRTYVNFTGNISHNISFRITPDITRESGSGSSLNGSYDVRLKYGFAQFNLGDWMTAGSWIRLGLQQTPMVDFLEGNYRYRFQGTVFPDREGFLTSSDSGVSMHANFSRNYGDVHVGIYNGEGYSKAEANNQKALQVRATIRPFATGSMTARGLRLTGFYDADRPVKGGDKTRAMFDATFEHKHFNAAMMYLSGKDQASATGALVEASGYSMWITPFFQTRGHGWEALLRYDSLKPTKRLDQRRNRFIGGLAYWFPHPGGNATAALLFDYEQQTFPGTVKQQKIALHGLINF